MLKFWNVTTKKNVEKEVKDVIKTDKIEGTVPKVVGVVGKLRADKAALEATVADMLVEAEIDQAKIDELENILDSLVEEGGSTGGI